MNSQMSTEVDTSDKKIPEYVDDPYDLHKMNTIVLIQYLLYTQE